MNHDRKIIYLVGFLLSIPVALTSYINSSFLEIYVGKNYVGLIYVIASIITIWSLLKIPKILTRLGNRLTTIIFCLLVFLSFIFLALGKGSFIIIPAFIISFIFINLTFVSLDIFIEDFSKKTSIGTFRGIYLTIINFAWVIAQLVSGSIIDKSSFLGIYLFSAGFMILVLLIFILFLHNFKDPEYKKVPISKTIGTFMQNRNLSGIYFINLILKFFYAWMVIYTPIYLHEYMNFSWDKIGIIFSIMLIPFILLEFPLGKLSDKTGEKKKLIGGFLIIIIFTLLIPFIKESAFWTWALVLFTTRIGAATIEVMSESYFFKEVSERNADEIDFFRNTTAISYIIAPILAVPILFFTPSFKYLFFVLGAVLLIGLFNVLRLKDVK